MMMNGKGFGRKLSCPNLRYYAGIHLEVLRKTMIHSISIAGRWAEICTPDLPKHKTGMLTT
jgi:hypothetical protein